MDENVPKVRKRDQRRTSRRQATASQRQVLEPASARSWRDMSAEEKDALRLETGMSDRRIIQFVQNRRARAKRRAASDPGPLFTHAALQNQSNVASTSGAALPASTSTSTASPPGPSRTATDTDLVVGLSPRSTGQLDPSLHSTYHNRYHPYALDIPVELGPAHAQPANPAALSTAHASATATQEDLFVAPPFPLNFASSAAGSSSASSASASSASASASSSNWPGPSAGGYWGPPLALPNERRTSQAREFEAKHDYSSTSCSRSAPSAEPEVPVSAYEGLTIHTRQRRGGGRAPGAPRR